MDKPLDAALVWFRRDLRVDDHAALYHALHGGAPGAGAPSSSTATSSTAAARRPARRVHPSRASTRWTPTSRALGERHGVGGVRLIVRHGHGADEIVALAAELHVQAVYANHDDDPYALARDAARARRARRRRHRAAHVKDHVVFERSEVLTGSGKPYTRLHAVQERLAGKLDAVLPASLPGRAPRRQRSRRRRRASTRALPGLAAHRLRARPTSTRSRSPTGSAAARRRCSTTSSRRIDDYDDGARLPGGEGPELSRRAPALRHGLDPRAGAARRARASPRPAGSRAAPRPGCPS